MKEKYNFGNSYQIASRLELVDGVRERFAVFLKDYGLSDNDLYMWRLAISEAIVNAIQHGNEADPEKMVDIAWTAQEKTIEVKVYDMGAGLPEDMRGEPSLPEDPYAPRGRGLFLIKECCDAVEHWRGDKGYCLVMRKDHADMVPVQLTSNSVYEQTLHELNACHENLAAFYRLGDGLVRSEHVSAFIEQALADLVKVIGCDGIKLSLTDTFQKPLLQGVASLEHVAISVPEEGTESDVFLSKEEYVWENLHEIRKDPVWMKYCCGFITPVQAAGNVQGVIVLVREKKEAYFNSAELKTIRTFADLIGIAVANANNTVVRSREQLAYREIELASELQKNLLPIPKISPNQDSVVFVERKSAREVAGDYVDVCFSKEGDVYLVIVDVMGKGVSAAFLASMFRTALLMCISHGYELKALMQALNAVLGKQVGDSSMFATCAIAKISKKQQRLEMINAGHCPIIYIDKDGQLNQIEPSGPPLGVFHEVEYSIVEQALVGGEKLYMITDGLYEWDCQQQIWGWKAFVDFLEKNRSASPQELWDTLQHKIHEVHENNPETDDDQTFLYWEKMKKV